MNNFEAVVLLSPEITSNVRSSCIDSLEKIINEKSEELFFELFPKKTWLDSFILPIVYTKVSLVLINRSEIAAACSKYPPLFPLKSNKSLSIPCDSRVSIAEVTSSFVVAENLLRKI